MMDDFTLSLITNRELLDINAYSTQNRPLVWDGKAAVWTCKDKNGRKVFGFFNLENKKTDISIKNTLAELSSFGTLRDIWTGEKITADEALTVSFTGRGSRVFVTE